MPPADAPADADLHRRLVHGEEAALAAAHTAYGLLVRAVALRVTRDRAAADEVAREVFALLWSRPYAFDTRGGSLRVQLSLRAHHRAVDWVRGEERHHKNATDETVPRATPAKGQRQGQTQRQPQAQGQSADAAGPGQERSLLLHSALARLPLPQQQMVHLAHFAGRTCRQAAVELGIPEATAQACLGAALRALAETLADPAPRGEQP
ncbi:MULTISPECIES: sigma-70 family RNA polymerase sigma factor [unclassified Streptomyces]|uniref:RNA polymerase sigma factor n=1 Tax=unclassified Streptomyces TaxID=2593676 RepID=UPI0033DA4418